MNKPQLFLFHFAGGNCYSYQFLEPYLKDFEIIALELPGRGERIAEPFINNYQAAIRDYYTQVKRRMNGSDIIIFGHSMGATLGWEVTKELQRNGVFPASLILSGNPGPGVILRRERYKLPRANLILELKKFGGASETFLESEELFDFFEPVLRADFEILERNEIVFGSAIETPVIALMGSKEEGSNQIENWRNYCKGSFSSKIMEGDHFFIYKYPKQIAEVIQKSYQQVISNT